MEAQTKEVEQALLNLGNAFIRNTRYAMETSTGLVQAQARAKHKFRTISGNAEASIVTEVTQNEEGTTGFVRIDPTVSNAPYTVFLHEGARPHTIVPRYKKSLRWVGANGFVFAKKVHHPGIQKDQFVYDALDTKMDDIKNVFKYYYDRTIKEAGLD
jgi:hypothetical protein